MAAKILALVLALTAASADCPTECVCEGGGDTCTGCAITDGYWFDAETGTCYACTCDAGTYCHGGSPGCEGCLLNKYCLGGTDQPQACATCVSGEYQFSACAPEANTDCRACNVAMSHCSTCSGANVCTLCQSGYWRSALNTCTACSCSSTTTCKSGVCGLGEYCSGGNSTCVPCTSAHFCAGGAAQPATCNSGGVTNCNCHDGTGNCVGCSPKYYLSGANNCSACLDPSTCIFSKRPFGVCFGTLNAICQTCPLSYGSSGGISDAGCPPGSVTTGGWWPANIASICPTITGTQYCPKYDTLLSLTGIYTTWPLQP